MTVAIRPAPTSAGPRRPRRTRGAARNTTFIWLFLTPTVLLYGAFTVYPIISSYVYSLTDWNGFDTGRSFIGMANYREVLADPMFWSSFRLTLTFMVFAVPLQVLATLLLAIVLNSPRMPLRKLFRTALFLPVVTTTAIIGVVMQFVFDPASGPVNLALREAGLVDGRHRLPRSVVDGAGHDDRRVRVEVVRDHPDLLAGRVADRAERGVRGGAPRRRGRAGHRCGTSPCPC